LQARDRFELKGRVAVAANGEGFNARLRWTQNGKQTRMSLDGPLGAGGVQVTSDGSAVSVVTSRGEHLDNDAARTELAKSLGFEPPLDSLRYWILGVPEPGHPAQESLDEQQRLATLQQSGWQIQYTGYMSVSGEWLPSKLTLQRQGVRLRVIVDGWDS
jgi:outer membrane lipoprotein LolB